MKTFITIALSLLVLTSVTVTAQSREEKPFYSYHEKSGGKLPVETIDNSSREMPPGVLLYSQPFNCPPWNGIMSTVNGLAIETADDFILTDATPVNFVRWWFYMEEDPTIPWLINIYNDESCLPSTLAASWNILVGSEYHQMVCTNGVYQILEHRAALEPEFIPVPGQHYWISIRAVNTNYDYWCCYGEINDYLNCPGVFRGGDIGSDFIPINQYSGWDTDFTFELYNVENTAVLDVPVSNWAIGLGIFLMIFVAMIRFRRLF